MAPSCRYCQTTKGLIHLTHQRLYRKPLIWSIILSNSVRSRSVTWRRIRARSYSDLLITSDVDAVRVCIVSSERIVITDPTKISHHLVVAVDKAHVNKTLPKFLLRESSMFPLQEYQVPVDQAS